MHHGATIGRSEVRGQGDAPGEPLPGLVLVFSERRPRLAALPLTSEGLVIGRGESLGVTLTDARMSRQHAEVRLDGERISVQDLGSRNGSQVDGEQARPRTWVPARRLVRLGDSLFLVSPDVRPFLRAEVLQTPDGRVMGPSTQAIAAAIGRAAQAGGTVHISGESGVGKEAAARSFHELGPSARGPFIAVNCAAIPEGIAERLLFGARRGAYSGAAGDAEGYVQAAHGGTLFLDEIGDLDLQVQGKLLRVLESKEVLALGATRPRPVELRVCSATHKDLRAQVAAGRLREDLYFRVARPEIVIPPLRERLEELPWLIAATLEHVRPELGADASLVETCLLRPWPGNIRELITEIRAAGHEAAVTGATKVLPAHLGPRAGLAFAPAPPTSPEPASPRPSPLPADPRAPEARPILLAALRECNGNVSGAARLLGLHRTQLRRLIAHHAIDVRESAAASEE
ncbi:sigma 54-interacting transcriptional regulator [Nannocystis sp. RBIL2]|uniref:sigma 54-interacting transcriptional regulator n=1 Tax=Nannocystis sp. RBIL2 TaxID=2996788 RepID=UPI002272284C|nr:sigma 54-interacting transcriptional regulator [Nannocystis sp. RBIL2]